MSIDKEQENLHFKSGNLIRISEADLDLPIYRVYSKRWLIEALTKKQNSLVKPAMWDDPFENFILKSDARMKDGRTVSFDTIRENYYGQCWTFSVNETDALWRIYSPGKDGFRVKTTIRKLWDSFYDPKFKWAIISFYLGRIIYEPENDIKAFFEDPSTLKSILLDNSGKGNIQTLLIKRTEFSHENELRLIFAGHHEWYDTSKKAHEYPIDINDLFEEILADPRMDDENADAYSNAVNEIRALGYSNPIEKSKLYQIPKLDLRFDM
ncbi:DUF2971 domain-containing protein [Pedobacter sp.]